ncbi:MAG: helix-turn-helix domain-containing protein [Kurthia gibsonii]
MAIGHIIRKERLNQNMKQSYLAKDICSPSYLSKIENNSTQPSRDSDYNISSVIDTLIIVNRA